MMLTLTEFFDKLEEDNCEDARKIFRRDYRGILYACSYDLDFSKKHRYWTFMRLIWIYIFHVTSLPLFFYSAFLLMDEIEAVSMAINCSVLIALSAVYSTVLHFKRKLLIKLHTMMARGIFNYPEGPSNRSDLKDYLSYIAIQRKLMLALVILILIINTLIQSKPIFEKQLGQGYETVYDKNGLNRQLSYPLYLPFDSSNLVGHISASIYLLALSYSSTIIIAGTMLVFSMCMFYTMTQLKTLICSVKDLPKRSKNLYCEKYNIDKMSLNKSKLRKIPEYQRCIEQCLKDNIIHHQNIKEFLHMFEDLGKIPIFATIWGLMSAFAVTMILLNTGEIRVISGLVFTTVAVGEFSSIVLIGNYGEGLLTLSEELRHELYFVPWHHFDIKNRKMLLTFQTGAQESIGFHTWMFRLDRELISNILQSAYSLFNFMRLSEKLEWNEETKQRN